MRKMRKIKFRAWDKKEKVMILFDEMAFRNEYTVLEFGSSQEEYQGICLLPEGLEDGEYDVMQFIGLKDRNNKDIYEGDIVHQKIINGENIKEVVGEVVFHIDKYCIWFNKQFDSFIEFDHRTVLYCEVIGNIWENPELLK